MRSFTPASLSRARARSSAGSAAGSCERNTASAAASRVAASGANRRRLPSAASTSPRTALFTRTGLRPLAMTSAAGLPVAASTNEPSSALMNSDLSAVRDEQAVRLQRRQDRGGLRMAGYRQHARHLAGSSRSSARPAPRTPRRPTARDPSPVPVPVRRSAAGRQDASLARFQKAVGGGPGGTGHPHVMVGSGPMPSCRHLSRTCRS